MHALYQAPDEKTIVFDPTPEMIASIFQEADDSYWLQGGNGEASIDFIRSVGEDVPSRMSLIRPDGVSLDYVAGEPSLWIKQPVTGRYFFTWDCSEGWYVPYDGGRCEDFVMDERGGDPFKIPRACLVDRNAAIAIASEFVVTRDKSAVVQWISWSDLPLPEDWDIC